MRARKDEAIRATPVLHHSPSPKLSDFGPDVLVEQVLQMSECAILTDNIDGGRVYCEASAHTYLTLHYSLISLFVSNHTL